jgi:cytochrome c peroxidase
MTMTRGKAAPTLRRAWIVVLCSWSAACAASTTVSEDVQVSRAALNDDCPCDEESKADEIELGRRLFADRNLSASGAESCASCHQAERAFSGNNRPSDALFPVSVGAFDTLLGSRNAPTVAYAAYSPPPQEGNFGTAVSTR